MSAIMNPFYEVEYESGGATKTYQVSVQGLLEKIAALTKRGASPKPLKELVMWLFPRDKNAPESKDQMETIFRGVANGHMQALNELINNGLVLIYEDDNKNVLINVTQEGLRYVPLPPPRVDINKELNRAKMFAQEVNRLEQEAPKEKKGMFRSFFS